MTSRRASRTDDHFPSTPRTWIAARLGRASSTSPALNSRIMSLYARPLRTYVRGSTFRAMGDADELVNGFFASRLANREYLHDWMRSGLRLRRWLMNGLLLYLHELSRRERRHGRARRLPDGLAAPTDASFERAYARNLVRQAMAEAQRTCESEGLERMWQAFVARHAGSAALAEFRQRHALTPGQTSHLVRCATARFRKALVDLVLMDGAHRDEADSEIMHLMRSLEP